MLDGHEFKEVPFYKLGPFRNRWGYIFAVAEIGELWILKWQSPYDGMHYRYFYDHEDLILAIHLINQDRRF